MTRDREKPLGPRVHLIRVVVAVAALVGAVPLAYCFLQPDYASTPIAHRAEPSQAASQAIGPSGESQAAVKAAGSGASPRRPLARLRVRLELFRVKLDYYALAWLLGLVGFAAGHQNLWRNAPRRMNTYLYLFGTVGLAGVVWALYQVAFHANLIANEYRIAIGSAVVVFGIGAFVEHESLGSVARNVLRDVWSLLANAPSWMTIAAVVLVYAMRPQAAIVPRSIPTGAGFAGWFKAQHRESMPARLTSPPGTVQVIKFNDYQCPPCKRAQQTYAPVIDAFNREHPGSVVFVEVDYPLDSRCNPNMTRSLHPIACEAAVAVRVARARGTDGPLREWLWANQEKLTPDTLRQAARRLANINDLDSTYDATVGEVIKDIEIGHTLGIEGTPTYFVDGVRLPFVPAGDFRTALTLALEKNTTPPARDAKDRIEK